jgi:hypothetical protein
MWLETGLYLRFLPLRAGLYLSVFARYLLHRLIPVHAFVHCHTVVLTRCAPGGLGFLINYSLCINLALHTIKQTIAKTSYR